MTRRFRRIRRRGRGRAAGALAFAGAWLLAAASLPAGEARPPLLWPGEAYPPPRQRGLNEVAELPTRDLGCPSCAFVVRAPEVDKLMRNPAGGPGEIRWRMDAALRDADLCPHPGPGKLAFQADLVTCPSCGFSAPMDAYYQPLSREAGAWMDGSLRPNIRAAQRRLLGRRAGLMTEEEIVRFFNRQADIPDSVRTEHARILSLARKDPALARARATWLAAWALRRELAAPPRGAVLARAAANVRTTARKPGPEAGEERAVLERLLTRDRSGAYPLPAAERLAARMLAAGLEARLGRHDAARALLDAVAAFCRDRYARPEQDPLWPALADRGNRELRRRELEEFRTEAEAEVRSRLELLRLQETLLADAATLLREAVTAGELDANPEEALFYAYLTGEFLRRSGSLPLAAEWFGVVLELAPAASPLAEAARTQLDLAREQAEGKENLLSAVGEDRIPLERIRTLYSRK